MRGSSSDDLDLASARSLFLDRRGGSFQQARSRAPNRVRTRMDERLTLRILGWALSGVVLLLFALAALSLPH